MLIPKKVKHRKWHKPRRGNKGTASRTNTIAFGTSRQIESARRVLTRYVRRGGKVWIRIFPDRPVTKKGSEVPMGKGKGAPDHYVCTVKPGTVMFEMGGLPVEKAQEALEFAGHKLPVKTKIITK